MLFCSIAEFCWISEIRRRGSLGQSCNHFLDSNPLPRLATRILFRIKDIFFRPCCLPSCGWQDSIAVSLFVYDLVEFDKYYQITRSKYLFWYWGEVPCLARLNNGCWSQTQCWLWPDSSQLLDGRPGIGREGINKIYDLILDAEIYHAAAFVMTMMDGIASVEF